jgi:membrane-bound lytic murein transglycosylase D
MHRGLIHVGVADRVGINLVVFATNGKLVYALLIAILTLTLSGCVPLADVQSDPSATIMISGQVPDSNSAQVGADSPLAADGVGSISKPHEVLAAPSEMPFVRSQPKTVPPFPLVLNRTVQQYVNQYVSQPQGLKQSFRRSQPYMPAMIRELQMAGLPTDLIYLAFAESGFSPEGDGPWQLEKVTARRFGLVVNDWVDERRDPLKSTRAAAEYLATLHDATGSDWRMTLVAWNNGDGTIDRYSRLRSESYERLMMKLPHHTRSLMNRFMAVALIARHASDYGLDDVSFDQPPHYKILKVNGGTLLSHISAMTQVSVDAIRQANPAILRDRVPADFDTYDIRVPDDELQAQLNEF